jgi:NADH:ubiquinone oxidoreductase subunit E
MGSTPTRSPTHRDVDMARLAGLGLDLEDIADDGVVKLERLVELAEDLGKPPSHYLAGLVLASELALDGGSGAVTVKACAGKCQSWGALDCIDRAVEKWTETKRGFGLSVVQCLDRCEHAAVVIVDSPDGTLVLQQATPTKLDEALDALVK